MRLLLSLLLLLTLTFVSCNKEKPQSANKNKSQFNVLIVADNEIGELLKAPIEELNQSLPVINNDLTARYHLQLQDSASASSYIASGKIKPDIWITNPEWVAINNNNIRNLGSPQTDCRALFGTPIVYAFSQNILNHLEIFPKDFAWPTIINALQIPGARLLLENPSKNTLGLATLHNMYNLAGLVNNSSEYLNNQLNKVLEFAQAYESKAADNLSNLVATKSNGAPVILPVTNRTIKSAGLQTGFLTFQHKTNTNWLIYQLCRSDMDWIGAEKIQAYELLYQKLSDPANQTRYQQAHYQILNAEAEKELATIEYKDIKLILNIWNKARRPQHLILLLDTSSSMPPNALAALEVMLQKLPGQFASNDKISLITFGGEVKTWLTNSSDYEQLIKLNTRLEAGGGSVLYDAILAAINIFAKNAENTTNYRNSVLVITDGPDNSSIVKSEILEQTIKIALETKKMDMKIVFLNEQNLIKNELAPLKELAENLGLVTTSAKIDNLENEVRRLWQGF